MSMYEPFMEQIRQYISEGYNLKEINMKLRNKYGVYGTYNSFYSFCKSRGITARKQECGDCIHCKEYDYKEIGGKIRICLEENRVVRARTFPGFCSGRFKARTEREPAE